MGQEDASSYGTVPSGADRGAGKKADREHPTHVYLRLRGMLTKPGDAAYRYNFITHRFDYVSPEITALLGFSEEEWLVMDMHEFVERLHLDDCHKVGDGLRAIIQGGSTILEYRLLGKDGSYHWVDDRVEIITDAEERPRYRVGVLREQVAPAEVVAGGAGEVPVERRSRVARWMEEARWSTATPRHGVRGSRAVAVAACFLLLLGGAYAYHTMRGVTVGPGPVSEVQVTPNSGTELAQQVRSLTAERDRLERRVRTLERRLAAARAHSGTEIHAAVAATQLPMRRPPTRKPQPKASTKGMTQVLTLFRVPVHQPIAPDPPTSR